MRRHNYSLIAAVTCAAIAVAGCGGSGSSHHPPIFSSQVSFGDSLSDVGTYAVGNVLVLGGGRYTVNSKLANGQLAPTNWTDIMATKLGFSLPCPAETGLEGQSSYNVQPVMHTPECNAYAQGGAMVTYPFGPGNASVAPIPDGNPVDGSPMLGQLTVPIVTQMQNHLNAHLVPYTGDEVVFILAGGSDAIFNTDMYLYAVQNAAQTGGDAAAAKAAEAAIAGPDAIDAMALAGDQLVTYINELVLAKGAQFVVVLNLPDLSSTPYARIAESVEPGTKALISSMVTTFNDRLQQGLSDNPEVLLVDAYSASVDQIANPTAYGLSNVTDYACDLSFPGNVLGSSLVCNYSNVIAGDISHYEFADQVHPTPYGNILIARYVTSQMENRGWL